MTIAVSQEKNIIEKVIDAASEEGIPKEIARGIVEGNWDEWKYEFNLTIKNQDKLINLLVKEIKKIYVNAVSSPTEDEFERADRGNPYMEYFPIHYSQKGLSKKTIEGLIAIAKDLDYEIGQLDFTNKNELLSKIKDLMVRAKNMENEYAVQWLENLMNELLN